MTDAHASPPLYRIEGLSKVYGEGPSAVHALRGVTLHIEKSAMRENSRRATREASRMKRQMSSVKLLMSACGEGR